MILLQQVLRGSRTLQHNLASRRCTLSFLPRASFAPSPITHMQASPILTVCHLEDDAPSWSASQRYYTLNGEKPSYKIWMNRKTKDESLDHLTFLFLRDGRNTRTTWTFEFPRHPENLLDRLVTFGKQKLNDADHELAAAFSRYVDLLVTFNQTVPSMDAAPHYVRYGFHKAQGSPLLYVVKERSSGVKPKFPKKWHYDDTVQDISRLLRLVDRERQLVSKATTNRTSAGDDPIEFSELDEVLQRKFELWRVAQLVNRRFASKTRSTTTWSEDDVREFLSLVKQGILAKDIAKKLGKTTDRIESALRKIEGLPLVRDQGAVVTLSKRLAYDPRNRHLARMLEKKPTTWLSHADFAKVVGLRDMSWASAEISRTGQWPKRTKSLAQIDVRGSPGCSDTVP